MIIVGNSVANSKYGVGVVIEQTNDYIHVDFNGLLKWYPYPTSFEKFLTAVDSDIQSILVGENLSLKQLKEEQANKKEETQWRKEFDSSKPTSNHQNVDPLRKNVAFKCTYCDGGKAKNQMGFAGVCGNTVMRYNVYERKQVWCSDSDCPCSQYLSNEITYTEIEWPCTESRLLLDWRADAGYYQNGDKRGQPIVMKEVQANSLCVLTTRMPNTPEGDRVIFGVFLVDEAYEGDSRESGFVTTESEYKIFLTDSEAKEMLFWKYHYNTKNHDLAHWGTGLFRYVEAEVSALILLDIVRIKKGTSSELLADRLLNKYCEINGIDIAKLPTPYGALIKNGL